MTSATPARSLMLRLRLFAFARTSRHASVIENSGLFDTTFYNTQLAGTELSTKDAIHHYLTIGASDGLDPNRTFDTKWYLDANPDVAASGVNPLVHYVLHGRAEDRLSSPHGDEEGLIVNSGLIDLGFYNLQVLGPALTMREAALHYLKVGAAQGLNPNPYFDTRWYQMTYGDVMRSGINPLVDFIQVGGSEGRDPSRSFDTAWYTSRYPETRRNGMNPLADFLAKGQAERRLPSPFSDSPEVPTRFRNILSDPLPQDGELTFRAWFNIRSAEDASPDVVKSAYGAAWEGLGEDYAAHAGRARAFPPVPYVASFRDIGVLGGTRLLFPDGDTVLMDEIASFRGSSGWSVRPLTYRLDASGALGVQVTRRYPATIESGLHLMHEYAPNYFHMICELLPRLIAAEEIGVDPERPVLIQQGLSENLHALLDCVNTKGRRTVELRDGALYRVGALDFVSDVSSVQDVYVRRRLPEETALHLQLIGKVAELVMAKYGARAEPEGQKTTRRNSRKRRLYITRGKRVRGLMNEPEVEEYLADRGFEIVSTEHLSLATQVKLFRDAEIVIAPTGAAVTNILWCRPKTAVFVLVSDHEAMPLDLWPQLGQVSGCSVSVIRCPRAYLDDGVFAVHDAYQVDMSVLRQIA